MDATFRSPFNFNFVRFFFETAAITGRKLDSGQQERRDSEVRFMYHCDRVLVAMKLETSLSRRSIMKNYSFEQKRHVTKSGNGALLNLEPFRSLKFAIDQWQVDLQREPAVELITGNDLCDGAVEILPGWIRHFLSVQLQRSKAGELLANGSVPSPGPGQEGVSHFGHRI